MKLQIKTLNQKSLLIDIDDTKTVFDLKQELAMYSDVGVRPELQKLIYAGKILSNDAQLSAYNIDVKKFLVVMVLKQPEEGVTTNVSPSTSAAKASTSKDTSNNLTNASTRKIETAVKEPSIDDAKMINALNTAEVNSLLASTSIPTTSVAAIPTRRDSQEEIVQNIVSMGYPEEEVRRALEASFFNPERAIEYLIEGIPSIGVFAEPFAGEHSLIPVNDPESMSPFEMFRLDPLFRNLRRTIQQHPELIDDAVQRVGEANPALLQMINENQQDFLSMLAEESDEDDDDDDDDNNELS